MKKVVMVKKHYRKLSLEKDNYSKKNPISAKGVRRVLGR